MAEGEGAFRLTFVQGRGLLSLARRDFEGLGRVDSLELEIPNLRFPFDLSGGVARFKNRRLRLRELSVFVGEKEITEFLTRAPLADFGIFHPRISVAGARLTLSARVALGGREAEVTALAAIAPSPPRSATLCVYGVRAYGFLPIPAPLVVVALFSALGAESPANRDSVTGVDLPSLIQVRSAAEIRLEVCDLVMLAILPMHGWRLPERSQVQIHVAGGSPQATRIPLVFSETDPAAPVDPLLGEDAIPAALAMRNFASRSPSVEEALARGDVASALAQLRALAPLDSDDRVGTRRLLQILLAAQDTLAEAGDLAQTALLRWPDFAPAVLALAVVAAERDQPRESAVFFERLAALSAAQERREDESCALLAAARQLARAGESEHALSALERALPLRSSLRPVARARIMKLAVTGHWNEIFAAIGEESGPAQGDLGDDLAQALELVHQGSLARDAGLVAQAADSLEDLLVRDAWFETPVSRAEAAYQLGLARLSLGDDQAASASFAACIEGDASGPVAAAAWRSLAELMHRRGDRAEEVQALLGWAGDARTPEGAPDKARHLIDAAEIALRDLHAPGDAAAYLETALAASPADPTVLLALEQLASQTGDPIAVADILRRQLRRSRPDQGTAILRVLIRLLANIKEREADVKEACSVLLELVPGDELATFYRARLAWDAGDRAAAAAGYQHSLTGKTLTSDQLAEAQLRTAEALLAEGKAEQSAHHLAQGLALEPRGARLEVLMQTLRALGQDDRLPSLLSARQAMLTDDDKAHVEVKRLLAASAERQGDLAAAEAMYRSLHEAAPDDVEWLDRLASICKRQSRDEDLRRWLEKLWNLAQDEQGAGAVDEVAVGLDFAELLARDSAGKAQAEGILRRLAERSPPTARMLDALHGLLLEREAFDQAAKVFAERLALTPAEDVPAFLLARTRACLARTDGLRPALAMLQSFAVEKLDEEALTLRTDLAERAGETADAVLCLQELRARAKEVDRPGLTKRLADLAARPGTVQDVSIAVLETLQAELPDSLLLAKALFDAYGRLDDLGARNQAWQDLLARVPALPDSYRARLQIGLAEAAEREGDLQSAEQMLDKAHKLDSSTKSRGEQLVVHARLLVARGELPQAQHELEQALSANPDSAGALALLGDLAYRAQDWEQARKAYGRLAQVPGAAAAVSAKLLAHRRAELAEMFGDQAEAESAYREVVALDPKSDSAREALAGFALARGDQAEAALHLREVARLLPKDEVDRLMQVRQRLGQVYLGLGDVQAARHNLELSLASDPNRASTLDLLVTAYQKAGLFREAAAMCEQLSRVLADPGKRAEALFRKGEILRASLADDESAVEAYLRASDLDPSFGPNLARLVSYYWSRGDLASLVDVGVDLLHSGPSPELDRDEVGLLVAVAALVARGDESLAKAALESPPSGGALRADAVAIRLGELVAHVARGEIASLDRALQFLCTSTVGGFEGELRGAVLRAVSRDPGDGAQCMLLGRLFERRGQAALARSAYSVAQFVDGGMGASRPLSDLGDETRPRLEAFFLGSHAVHPLARGPLRKVLQHLALALVSPGPAPEDTAGSLQPATVAICERLRRDLSAPAIPFVAHGEGVDVTLSANQPLRILIGRRAEALPPEDLRFFVARALEQARAGTLTLLRMSQENLRGMLQAVLHICGEPGTPFDVAGEKADDSTALWLDRLSRPETAALLPLQRVGHELAEYARQALAQTPEIDAYIRGCRYTADRIGLLASGKPLSVLRALAGSLKDSGMTIDTATVAQKQDLLRNSHTLRELVAFMLSEEYSALVVGA